MKIKRIAAAVCTLLLCGAVTGQTVFAAAPPKREVVVYQNGEQIKPDVPETTHPVTPPTIGESDALIQQFTIRSQSTGELITDTMYNILCMVVEAEVGSGFAPEAIKAQTVATHSYLKYHADRGSIVTCPVKKPESRVKEMVLAVRNEVLTYDGKVAEAVYCASSGGGTQSSADYWGGNVPYLQAVECPYDVTEWSRTLDREYVREWFPESNFSENPKDWFEVTEVNSTGFALTVRAGDKLLQGGSFTSYDHIWLRSNKIKSIVYDAKSDTFTFTVLGWGHGVGMSQIGANGYAKKEGRDYTWILRHFFTGVTLVDLSKGV